MQLLELVRKLHDASLVSSETRSFRSQPEQLSPASHIRLSFSERTLLATFSFRRIGMESTGRRLSWEKHLTNLLIYNFEALDNLGACASRCWTTLSSPMRGSWRIAVAGPRCIARGVVLESVVLPRIAGMVQSEVRRWRADPAVVRQSQSLRDRSVAPALGLELPVSRSNVDNEI